MTSSAVATPSTASPTVPDLIVPTQPKVIANANTVKEETTSTRTESEAEATNSEVTLTPTQVQGASTSSEVPETSTVTHVEEVGTETVRVAEDAVVGQEVQGRVEGVDRVVEEGVLCGGLEGSSTEDGAVAVVEEEPPTPPESEEEKKRRLKEEFQQSITTKIDRSYVLRAEGNALFKTKEDHEARLKYLEALELLLVSLFITCVDTWVAVVLPEHCNN